jgi:hypothetical protein
MAVNAIDVEFVYDRFLGAPDDFVALAGTLEQFVGEWLSSAELYEGPRDRRPLNVASGVAFRDAVLGVAAERGPTYARIVKEHGPGDERLVGSAEIRGRTSDLTIVISVDERVVSPLGLTLALGNDITFQLRGARVQGVRASEWAARVFDALVERTQPVWGAAYSVDEYLAKVMSDGPGVAAVGRDFGRFLPGLFTRNFFGSPYVELIGRDRLLSVGHASVEAVGSGIVLALAEDTRSWDSEARRAQEQQVLDELGPQYFFSKLRPDRETSAPDWRALMGENG